MTSARQLDEAFDRFDEGRAEDAARICENILQGEPDFYGALYLLGSIRAGQGRDEDARRLLERAVAVHPEKKVAHFNLAKVLLDLDEPELALARIEAFLKLDGQDAEAHAVHGAALLALARHEDAKSALDRAVALAPAFAQAWYNRGNVFKAQARLDEAIADFDKAIALEPNVAAFHINRGVALHGGGRFAEAIACYDRALQLDPTSADAFSNRGISHHALERFDEARADYGKALAIAPDHSEARANRAYTSLLLGDFASGWDDYEHRLKSRDYARIALGENARLAGRIKPFPAMGDIAGRHLVLIGEQGVGDIVMFASMIEDACRVAARVELVVERRLCALMAGSFPQLRVTPVESCDAAALPADATCLFIGSLASLLRRERARFPQTAYLKAGAAKVSSWTEKLGAMKRKRIGISWQGGMAHTRRAARSMSLEDFLQIFDAREDISFVNLQHGYSASEVNAAIAAHGIDMRSFPAEALHDFSDLAALIASLDAVVTVQNSNVHVSGALGIPCLTILPPVPEWRYATHGARMPWYGSVELFRRATPDGLAELLPALRSRLTTLLGN